MGFLLLGCENRERGRGNGSFPVAELTNRWVRGSDLLYSESRHSPTPLKIVYNFERGSIQFCWAARSIHMKPLLKERFHVVQERIGKGGPAFAPLRTGRRGNGPPTGGNEGLSIVIENGICRFLTNFGLHRRIL